MKILMTLFFCIPVLAMADCNDLQKFKLGLEAHGSNWANAITTRTSEGGPYKVKSLNCKNKCNIIDEEKFILKYEPNHPDANTEGYVNYPDIRKEEERAAISSYAKSIRLISSSCKSKVITINNGDSLLVKYISSDVKSDIFNFTKSNKVISWIREDRNGKTHIFNF